AYANIFQLAVWEIANDTASNLDLRDGDISLLSCSKGSTVLDATLNTLDSWFKAIVDDSWGDIGYAEDRVSLTVFMPEGGNHVSQTFIGVAVAPEPATMLIFGLGIVGAAAARRRRK
ncbi:MAG: PEP-CTERM sorting domain-containing protein, partial [Planctomycetaceae bacterium]|nr:PEP-CTERM sorting domain-containing protein [Planctomycetaceae bacterium]